MEQETVVPDITVQMPSYLEGGAENVVLFEMVIGHALIEILQSCFEVH